MQSPENTQRHKHRHSEYPRPILRYTQTQTSQSDRTRKTSIDSIQQSLTPCQPLYQTIANTSGSAKPGRLRLGWIGSLEFWWILILMCCLSKNRRNMRKLCRLCIRVHSGRLEIWNKLRCGFLGFWREFGWPSLWKKVGLGLAGKLDWFPSVACTKARIGPVISRFGCAKMSCQLGSKIYCQFASPITPSTHGFVFLQEYGVPCAKIGLITLDLVTWLGWRGFTNVGRRFVL